MILDSEQPFADGPKVDEVSFESSQSAPSEWYYISNEWLQRWKCFVTNHVSSKSTTQFRTSLSCSPNGKIGVLPPGIIDNFSLLELPTEIPDDDSDFELGVRPNLQPEIDYKTIKKAVWLQFERFYGGGPAIVRRE